MTKLDNEGAAQTVPKVQKELLKGRYQIKIKDEMPYNEKILRMAQEPVAFHLYKNRDFYILDPKSIGQKHLNNKKNFKNELLRIANAKLITAHKFKTIIDHH